MLDKSRSKSYEDTPFTLKSLCCKEITKEIRRASSTLNYLLPPVLGHMIFDAFRQVAEVNRWQEDEIETFLENFKHEFIPLTKINLSGLRLKAGRFLDFIDKHRNQLVELNISKCYQIYPDLKKLNEILKSNQSDEKSLILGETFSRMIEKENCMEGRLFDDDLRLNKLVLHNIYSGLDVDEFATNIRLSKILTPTMSHSLKYLDLSMCLIGKGSALMQLGSLEVLILYDCAMKYPDVISTICQLKKLRVLDISRQAIERDDSTRTTEELKQLDLLVSRLPELTRLDISGTNLMNGNDRNISAFESRMDRPFEFLGLFHTGDDAAYKSCIPALVVAGEANESQILNACEAYLDRPAQLLKALGDLYNYYKTITPSDSFDDISRAIDIVLLILKEHISDEQVIIFTTAALWCIVKINVSSRNLSDDHLHDVGVRKAITSRLLDVMHYHKSSRVLLINGGLSLLLMPELINEHSRVASISLLMCRDRDGRTQGFGTTLLNTLACQVGGDQKIFMGSLGAIETMIEIIKKKIDDQTCDEILETAWSTLWNITDETSVNCEKFLDNRGLEVFEFCMDRFWHNKEVVRNMMGLLGNVAECAPLRVKFMEERYINRFFKLLGSQIDGIECSYNACGSLAYIVSDGEEFWNKNLPKHVSRRVVLDEMYAAISEWPINSMRNINYRSFTPIMKLLDVGIVAEAQYWAVFALTNLTRINPAKYCPMLLPNGGLDKMRELAKPGMTEPFVSEMVQVALYQYDRFESEGTLAGLEQTDSKDLNFLRNFRVAETNQEDVTNDLVF